MAHKCKCSCEHKNVQYCKDCGKVHCVDCGQEFEASPRFEYVPYFPSIYPVYPVYPNPEPYKITWTDFGNSTYVAANGKLIAN